MLTDFSVITKCRKLATVNGQGDEMVMSHLYVGAIVVNLDNPGIGWGVLGWISNGNIYIYRICSASSVVVVSVF